jgi:hypothetical protein
MRVPDLANGYMVNTYDGYNRFQTFVECALETETASGIETAYLSSRCRPESLSPDSIFNGLMYTFGIVHTTRGTWQLHSGSSQASRNPFGAVVPEIKPTEQRSIVHCPVVEVAEVGFDEALAWLQTDTPDKHNRLYMEVAWQAGEVRHRLFTPCRYTNFPNPTLDHALLWRDKPRYPRHEHRYIQPISGWVVFHDGAAFHPAYVAVHLTAQGAQRVEFCLRAPTSFFSLRRGRLARWLAATPLGRYFAVSEFHKVVPLDATCRLYRHDL